MVMAQNLNQTIFADTRKGEKMDKVFTFWEGPMSPYIELCMDTWQFPYIILNYENLHHYTDLDIEKIKGFTLPQIADCVRVHTLRDQGGYWLDADTIMVTDELPTTSMIGYPETRGNTIGYLHTEPHSDMYEAWAGYQMAVYLNHKNSDDWSVMGNAFTDKYLQSHRNISICSVENCWPETYMIKDEISRYDKYQKFYFDGYSSYHLSDIRPTNMIMLHNSWTPNWYKQLSKDDVLAIRYTLSNILREVLKQHD